MFDFFLLILDIWSVAGSSCLMWHKFMLRTVKLVNHINVDQLLYWMM